MPATTKLLVVDDHSLIREAVRHVVGALADGVTVFTAADCDEGFAIAERGGKYLPAEVLGSDEPTATPPAGATPESLALSPRQLEVLKRIAQGKPNKIICDELGLAERTVKAHVTEVLRAWGVSSRTQAALAAARMGLGDVSNRR